MPACDYCHHKIPESVHPYTLRLELFPAVEPSLKIRKSDFEIDFEAEMKRLIESMEAMDDQEVKQQERLVYTSHCFTLCPRCREKVGRQLAALLPPHKD